MKDDVPNLKDYSSRLREEANMDLADIKADGEISEPTKKTQIVAIYGKGGIGKSFTLANLSHMMAELGKRVLLIGCDPKSDTTSLLFGGKACPTIIETSTKKKLAGEEVKIGDLEVKYNKSSQSTGTVNNIFDVYPWLQSFLGAYCSGGSGSYQVRVMRG